MPIRNIFFICTTILGIGSAGFAQQTIALPLDADNCAIHLALSPETSGNCLNRKSGLSRGIVLRIDDVVKSNATISRPMTPTSKQQRPIAPTFRVASAAPRVPPQEKTSPSQHSRSRLSRAAAEPGNGYYIHFAFDSAQLEPAYKEHLNRLSDVLKVKAMSTTCLKIIGHTDTVGDKKYNKRLSLRRANTVATYLKTKRNIPSSRLMIEAAGETRPLPDIKGDDARNRRVEFVTKESSSGCT